MNYLEAMAYLIAHPAGQPGAAAVTHPGLAGFVYYDQTLFLGIVPLGFRYARSLTDESSSWDHRPEDLVATDWTQVQIT